MSIFTRLFKRRTNSAAVAEGRLVEVLAKERALPVPMRVAAVTLRQSYDGLIITFGEGVWGELLDELCMQLESPAMRDLFDGAQVRLELGERKLSAAELEELSLVLARHRMVLNPLREDKDGLTPAPRAFPLVPPEAFNSEVAYAIASPSTADAAGAPSEWLNDLSARRDPVLLLRHSIVAGQVIHYGGTIVILGDVSPAAQLIAERDIYVLGKLRGVAHAGASGDEGAVIAALFFEPTQARIAGLVAGTPQAPYVHTWPAEMARVRDGRIVTQPWSAPE